MAIFPGLGGAASPYANRWTDFLRDLQRFGVQIDPSQSGGYNPRNIAGTNTPSQHASGRAYDVNWNANPEGSTYRGPQLPYDMYGEEARSPTPGIHPDIARDVSQRHGMRWGGDFTGRSPDPMHFEMAGVGQSPPMAGRSITQFAGSVPPFQTTTTPAPATPFNPVVGRPEGPPQSMLGSLDWMLPPEMRGAGRIPNLDASLPPEMRGPAPPAPAAPFGMPPVASTQGFDEAGFQSQQPQQSQVPPFQTATAPTPIDADAIMQGAVGAQGQRQEAERNQPGYMERLLQNPAFLAGLSILGTPPGGAWGPAGAQAAQAGFRSRRDQEEHQRQQQQRSVMDRVWGEAFPNGQPNMNHPLLQGMNPQVASLMHTLGAEQALPLLARSRMAGEKWDIKDGMLFNERTGQIIQIQGGGGKPPSGYRWSQDGSQLEPIPGGPGEHIASEVAGRLAMIRTAKPQLAQVRQFFTRSWGAGETARNAFGGSVVAPEYDRQTRVVRVAIEGALRAMTGAAAPQSEVDQYMTIFMPRVIDPPATARQKLDLLEQFMTQAESIVTQGRRPAGTSPQAGGDGFSIRRLP